ncbi:hypothetical protein CC79DRAFT_1070349 [Sarocladium strictum]
MSDVSAGPAHRVRKLRKGTHSCQQCRRRKAKCVFDAAAASRACVGCTSRGLECHSQIRSAVPDETTHPGSTAGEDAAEDLTDRLARLEQLISSMASSGDPSNATAPVNSATTHPEQVFASPPSTSGSSINYQDILDSSVVQNARTVTASDKSFFLPGTSLAGSIFGSSPMGQTFSVAQNPISAQLYALLPPEATSSLLISNGPSMFLGPHGPGSHAAEIRPTDHPTLIARRLMMLALCLQQLPSSFDISALTFHEINGPKDSCTIIRNWLQNVSSLVTSDDSLISNAEGVETLILQAVVQADSGHLRKAWMIGRKAICIAMLLGFHHDQPSQGTTATSCIPGEIVPPQTIESLWFRANCIDRYASLVLGLPPTSTNNKFASEHRVRNNTPEDRLGKAYAVCAGSISERNNKIAAGRDGLELTRFVELELESVAHLMDSAWWHSPGLRSAGSGLSDELMVMNLQVRHHVLTVLLHLPYMLQQAEQDTIAQGHSRSACMHACRAVVHRFVSFRRVYNNIATGRQIDYAALLSAMTLLQGHILHQQMVGTHLDGRDGLKTADVELIDSARHMMQEISTCNAGDSLSREAARSLQELLDHLKSNEEVQTYTADFGAEMIGEVDWQQDLLATPPDDFSSGLDPALVFPVQTF